MSTTTVNREQEGSENRYWDTSRVKKPITLVVSNVISVWLSFKKFKF